MSTKCPVEFLAECFELRGGSLVWRTRPAGHFANAAAATRVNSRMSGKAAGVLGKDGYIMVRLSHQGHSRLYPAHQIVWAMTRGDWPEREIDHRDNVRSNNDPGNLRLADRWQNMSNLKMHRDNRVGFKGVVEHQGGYRARILINGRMADLGVFSTPELAHAAYCRASEERGEFSRTE